jgi:ELWxxDGT repeat protein
MLMSVLVCPAVFSAGLVKDINAVPIADYAGGSGFGNAVQTNGGTLFFTRDADHGLEPWITDGTPAGTRLLKDIRPGPLSSNPEGFWEMVTLMNGVAYFWADDGANGVEMWRSDGTTDGTRILANIGPGAANGASVGFVAGSSFPVINGVLFFGGDDGVSGGELWRTDGTSGGTYRLMDGTPGSVGINPIHFRVLGSRLYFVGGTLGGSELWTSDGTPAGTRRVADTNQVPGTDIDYLTVVGDVMFFAMMDTTHGYELWRANAAGTASLVADLNTTTTLGSTTTGHSGARPVAILNNALLFAAYTSANGGGARLMRVAGNGAPTVVIDSLPPEIYRVVAAPNGVFLGFHNPNLGDLPAVLTDGTEAGTDFFDGVTTLARVVASEARGGGEVFFAAVSGAGARNNIWRSDGTRAGTRLYATIDNIVLTSDLEYFGGKLYFPNGRHTDSLHGEELWVSDGTPGGTHIVADLSPGPENTGLAVSVVGNRMYLDVFDGVAAREPWVSDGTEAGTRRLADLESNYISGGSDPHVLGSLGADAFFSADDGVHGRELWATNGTGAGTRMLRDVATGSGVDESGGLFPMTGFALFAGVDAAGTELWRTDGTAAGTWRVKDIQGGAGSGAPRLAGAVLLNGFAYFLADDGAHGSELWRTDGTDAGTTLVVDLPADDAYGRVLFPVTANGRIYVRSGGDPPTLWSTDGTAGGTVQVTNALRIGIDASIAFQDRVCFPVHVVDGQVEYFCSNGAAGNATRITNFEALNLTVTSRPYVLNGQLMLSAVQPGSAGVGGIYLCDGNPNALTRISTMQFYDAVALNGGSSFAFRSQSGGVFDIGVTDGTPAGTRSMLAGTTLDRNRLLQYIAPVGDSIVFVVNDAVRGPVTWKTDGTVSGTRFLFDVDPSSDQPDGPPAQFHPVGGRVYFTAMRAGIGQELWSFTMTNPNATDDYANAQFNTPVVINTLSNDSDFDSSLAGATIDIVSPPAFGTTSVNSGAGTITYTPNNGYAGIDRFVYRVMDSQGNFSAGANVSVLTATAVSNTAPGTAPVSPPANPPSNPPPSGGAGGGGGGGSLGLEAFALALMLAWRRRRGGSPGASDPRAVSCPC